MTSWVRAHIHPDPTLGRIRCTVIWKAGHYAASVVEPEGESRVPERVLCGEDTDAAKAQADHLLLGAYPHDCRTQRCEPWQPLDRPNARHPSPTADTVEGPERRARDRG